MLDDRDQPVEAVPSAPAPFEPTVTRPVVEPSQPFTSGPTEEAVMPPVFTPASMAVLPQPEPQQPALVAPVAPVTAQVPAASDQVWISKEEYQRLQQAQVIASHDPAVAEMKPAKLISGVQIAAGITAAIGLMVGLIGQSTFFGLLIAPSLVVLAIMGAFTLHDYLKAKKPGAVLKPHKARNGVLLTAAIIVLALPLLLPVFLILIFMITCAGGGCKGS